MYTDTDLAQTLKVLAQIEPLAQVGKAGLTLSDLCCGRRGQQPLGQGLFPHSRSRRREQIEKAAAAEEVQVRGVDMMWIQEALPRLTAADPSVVDAIKSPAVEGSGALCAFVDATY
jgi:hypothetical protein